MNSGPALKDSSKPEEAVLCSERTAPLRAARNIGFAQGIRRSARSSVPKGLLACKASGFALTANYWVFDARSCHANFCGMLLHRMLGSRQLCGSQKPKRDSAHGFH